MPKELKPAPGPYRDKYTTEMTLEELRLWAVGHVMVELGRGEFRSAIRFVMTEAYAAGFRAKEQEKKK